MTYSFRFNPFLKILIVFRKFYSMRTQKWPVWSKKDRPFLGPHTVAISNGFEYLQTKEMANHRYKFEIAFHFPPKTPNSFPKIPYSHMFKGRFLNLDVETDGYKNLQVAQMLFMKGCSILPKISKNLFNIFWKLELNSTTFYKTKF